MFHLSRKPLFYILSLPLVQIVLVAAMHQGWNTVDLLTHAGLLLVSVLSSFQLFEDMEGFSLNQIWWLFNLIFMGLMPAVQLALRITPWHSGDVLPQTLLKAVGVILGCLIAYSIVHWWFASKALKSNKQQTRVPSSTFNQRAIAVILLSSGILFSMYSLVGLFLRSEAEAASGTHNSSLMLLGDKAARGALLAISLLAIHFYYKGRLTLLMLLGLLTAVLLLNFPMGIPRYLVLTIYGAWLVSFGKAWLTRKKYFFRIALSCLLLFAAPFTSIIRYIGTPLFAECLSHPRDFIQRTYLLTDFDAYSSLCRAIQHTEKHGITQGRQLAGVGLFFIPRQAWPEKPIGSGAFIFKTINQGYYLNVSCTYLAEGWINFGLIGSLLFAVLMALFIAWYDKYYHASAARNTYSVLFYPAMLGLMLFVLRGDLLSSFAYTVGLFVSGWAVAGLLTRPKPAADPGR